MTAAYAEKALSIMRAFWVRQLKHRPEGLRCAEGNLRCATPGGWIRNGSSMGNYSSRPEVSSSPADRRARRDNTDGVT
jgi:hypothetical protein